MLFTLILTPSNSRALFGFEIEAMVCNQEQSKILIKVLSSLKESKDRGRLSLPVNPGNKDTRNHLIFLNMRLLISRYSGKNRRSIMDRYMDWMPDEENPATDLIKNLLSSSALINSELFLTVSIKTLAFCLSTKKRTELLPLVFAGVAVAFARRSLANRSRRGFKKAEKMARLSETMADLYTMTETCHSNFICLAYVSHFNWPIRNTLEPLLLCFKQALRFGETEIACQAIVCWVRYSLYSGESMSYIENGVMINWWVVTSF
jgi:hypothetical protein